MTEVEIVLATIGGSVPATLIGKIVWERWRAPEKYAKQASETFVTRAECERCSQLSQLRLNAIEKMQEAMKEAQETMRRENREDHGRLFKRLDEVVDAIHRSNGKKDR